MPTTIIEAFAAAGIGPERIASASARWGSKPSVSASGAYIVSVTGSLHERKSALTAPQLASARFEEWLEVCPKLTLDGSRPTRRDLMGRIRRFWVPDEVIVYIGLAASLSARLSSYYKTPIGACRPHSGGYFLKLLSNLDQLWVHYAVCADPADAECKMLRRFCENVSDDSKKILYDPSHPFPFGNLEWPRGVRKAHGLRRARQARA
jgi:hypothetical protein